MRRKLVLIVLVVIVVGAGVAVYVSHNRNELNSKQNKGQVASKKKWSNSELVALFHKNEAAFSIVAQGLENEGSGFQIDVDGRDLSQDTSLSAFSEGFMSALNTLQRLQMINNIHVDDQTVTFELNYIDDNYRGYYIYSRSGLEAGGIMHEMDNGWYLATPPNT